MTRTRRAALAAALAALALTLSGCIKTELVVDLHPDDTASTSLVIAVEDEFVESTGRDPQDVLDDALRGKDDPSRNVLRTEEYSEGGYTGNRYVYPDVPLSSLAEAESVPVTVVREGDDYVLDATVDLTEDNLGIRGVRAADVLTATLRVTFPGPVTETDGIVSAGPGSGSTVTWTPPVGEVTTIHARGSAVDPATVPSPSPTPTEASEAPAAGGTTSDVPEWLVLVLGLGGLAILLLTGLLVWQALRVRPDAGDRGAPPYPPAGYPAQPYPPQPPDPGHPPSYPPRY